MMAAKNTDVFGNFLKILPKTLSLQKKNDDGIQAVHFVQDAGCGGFPD